MFPYSKMRSNRKLSKHTQRNYMQAWKMCERLGYSTDDLKNDKFLVAFLKGFHSLKQKNGNPYKNSSLIVRLDNLRELLRVKGIDDPQIITDGCDCTTGAVNVRCTNHKIHNCIQKLKSKSATEGSKKLTKLKDLGIIWDDYKNYCVEMQKIVEHELSSKVVDTTKLVDAFVHTFIYNMGAPCRLNYTCKIVHELPHIENGESYLLINNDDTPQSLVFNDKMTNILGTCIRDIPAHFKPLLSLYIKYIQTNGNNHLFIIPNGLPMTNMVFRTRVSRFKYNGTPINMNDLRALYITMRYENTQNAHECFLRQSEISLEMRQKVMPKSIHITNYLIE